MYTRFLFVVVCFLISALQFETPSETHGLNLAAPTLTIDLHSEGYSSGPFHNHGAPSAKWQITFGSTNELVVTNDTGVCGKANPVTGFVLDSRSGKLLNKAKWVSNCWPYIFGTAQGHYAVVTNEGMALYSPELRGIVYKAPDVAAESISADGRVLGAWKQIPSHGQTYFLDADTLQPTGSQFLDKRVVSIFANSVAYIVTRSGSPNQILLLDNGKSTLLEYKTKCGQIEAAEFISSNVLTVIGCGRAQAIDTSGNEVFSDERIGHAGQSDFAGVARDGSRFAITQTFKVPRGEWPDQISDERVFVFDVKARKAVFATDLQILRGLDAPSHSSGIALSPDGSLLAADSEGVIQIYRLP